MKDLGGSCKTILPQSPYKPGAQRTFIVRQGTVRKVNPRISKHVQDDEPVWQRRYRILRRETSLLLNEPRSSCAALVLHWLMILLIIGSSFTLCLGTMDEYESSETIERIELVCRWPPRRQSPPTSVSLACLFPLPGRSLNRRAESSSLSSWLCASPPGRTQSGCTTLGSGSMRYP